MDKRKQELILDELIESKDEYSITAFRRDDMDWFRDNGKIIYGKFGYKVAVINKNNNIVKFARDTSHTMQWIAFNYSIKNGKVKLKRDSFFDGNKRS